MNVEVRLHGSLTATRPGLRAGDPFGVELPPDSTVSALLQVVGLEPKDVHLVIVNGRIEHERDAFLADRARVGLFPPVGGG